MVELYTVAPTIVIEVGASLGEYYSLDNVARLGLRAVGMQSDDTAKQIALEGIMAAAADLDASYDWHWMSYEGTNFPLVADQRDYLVDAQAMAIRNVYLINKTDPDNPVSTRLTHLLWDQVAREFNAEGTGTPSAWSIFNFADNQKISIFPAPNELAVATYEVRVEWYQETYIPPFNTGAIVIGDNGTKGPAPKQICEAIVHYVKGHLIQTYDPEKTRLWAWHFDQFAKKTKKQKGKENRQSGGPIQIIPVGIRPGGRRLR